MFVRDHDCGQAWTRRLVGGYCWSSRWISLPCLVSRDCLSQCLNLFAIHTTDICNCPPLSTIRAVKSLTESREDTFFSPRCKVKLKQLCYLWHVPSCRFDRETDCSVWHSSWFFAGIPRRCLNRVLDYATTTSLRAFFNLLFASVAPFDQESII